MKKARKEYIIVISIVLFIACITIGVEIDYTPSEEDLSHTPCGLMEAAIKREERNILSDDGRIIGQTFFEYPIILGGGNKNIIEIINQYFFNEKEAFFEGTYHVKVFPENRYSLFLASVTYAKELWGTENLAEHPFEYSVSSEITYLDTEIISVKEKVYWMAGGVSNIFYFGKTFSLNTGDEIPISCFVGNNEEEFQKKVIDLMSNSELCYDYTLRQWIDSERKCEFYYIGNAVELAFPELSPHGITLVYELKGDRGRQMDGSF